MRPLCDITDSEVLTLQQVWTRSLPGIPTPPVDQLKYWLWKAGQDVVIYAIGEAQRRRDEISPALNKVSLARLVELSGMSRRELMEIRAGQKQAPSEKPQPADFCTSKARARMMEQT